MDIVVKEMIKIYRTRDICWMGYKITRNNPLTYHHCNVKACDGGKRTFENGALLSEIGHSYLNLIEFKDFQMYTILNEVFKIINKQQHAPTKEQYMIINSCLKYFEAEHKNDISSKGKILIKPEYYKRSIYNLK